MGHTLWCWGSNDYGQLGVGDRTVRLAPTRVGEDTTWAQVQGGLEYTCGIRLDRTMWCWGDNSYGQLGVGDRDERLRPTRVGLDSDWAQIRLGDRHACGIRLDHTLWCWGTNQYGQLGVGEREDGQWDYRGVPTQVGTGADWEQVEAGDRHTCATRLDQTFWCWGSHDQGQLGLGRHHKNRYLSPVQVGTGSDWADIGAGGPSTCATRLDRALWCWGDNFSGELGLGDTRDRFGPHRVRSENTWAGVTGGAFHTCAIRRDHTIWCWGNNDDGQLGLGGRHRRLVPTQV